MEMNYNKSSSLLNPDSIGAIINYHKDTDEWNIKKVCDEHYSSLITPCENDSVSLISQLKNVPRETSTQAEKRRIEQEENIFDDRVLLATIIEDITRLREQIDFIQRDQVLLSTHIQRMLKEELIGA